MASSESMLAARGVTDVEDRLISADPPLAELQERCGGSVPGLLAVPELLELVRQGRQMGLRIAREFSAYDGVGRVSGFVRVHPVEDAGEEQAACELFIENWHREGAGPEDAREAAARADAIDRASAELTARLDANQRLLTAECNAHDLGDLGTAMRSEPGKQWHEYLELAGVAHRQPLHWRLLDGVACRIAGSDRHWHARLLPIGGTTQEPAGFELLLCASHALVEGDEQAGEDVSQERLIGDALAPALRQPVSRIIANAETIKAKLAGPLRHEYSDYAADISSAGQHLAGMLDDLADLEVVENKNFAVASDRVDLVDAARRAAGILGVRARDKEIGIALPAESEQVFAIGEFRRVLQILLNLIGNAINYSPTTTSITIMSGVDREGRAAIAIADEGPGIAAEQIDKVFEKFERLGRDGDGGSGLGLYISRRLARAMGGDLVVESERGEGATFTLLLPTSS